MSDDFKLYNMFVRKWKQILHDLLLDDFSCVQKVLIFRITDTHTHTMLLYRLYICWSRSTDLRYQWIARSIVSAALSISSDALSIGNSHPWPYLFNSAAAQQCCYAIDRWWCKRAIVK